MSPVASRSLCIGVFVFVLGICLAAVSTSLASILIQRVPAAEAAPSWLWQSSIVGGVEPKPAAAPARTAVPRRARPHTAPARARASTWRIQPPAHRRSHRRPRPAPLKGIHKIRHIIFVAQENRSFDSYFGTFPGADGIPMANGVPTVCVPDPNEGTCVRPYHDTNDMNFGGPHNAASAVADMNGFAMDGFIGQAEQGRLGCLGAGQVNNPQCSFRPGQPDVMGYHDGAEIPNYWAYARHYVLMDHMFETNLGWSEPAHLFMVSGWSARCRNVLQPMTCATDLVDPGADNRRSGQAKYGWTDITWMLHRYGISWKYYVSPGQAPDCASGAEGCAPTHLPSARRRSGTRCRSSRRCARTASRATSSTPASTSPTPPPANCRPCRGWSPTSATRSIRRHWSPTARPGSPNS